MRLCLEAVFAMILRTCVLIISELTLMWLIVHQITKTIVCLLLFSFCLSWVEQPLLSFYFFEEINTEEGEFIITKNKTRILSFHHNQLKQ